MDWMKARNTRGRESRVVLVGGLMLLAAPSLFAGPLIQGYVMDVQMAPAVCAIDRLNAKKRKCLEGYSLNIAGLFPQTHQSDCSTSTSAKLPPLQAKVVARIMPEESARNTLWRTIGGCTGMNASQYFRTIINHADRLKVPEELTGQETTLTQLSVLRTKMIRLNPGLPQQGIQFFCQNSYNTSMLTNLKICYKNNGQYQSCGQNVLSNCPASFTIKGTF